MLQKGLFLLLFSINLLGQTFSFQETRYNDGLGRTFGFEGLITFNDQQTIIEYIKPQARMLVYFEGALSLQDDRGYRMIDFAAAPSIHYFFMLIRALHEEDVEQLEAFFEQEEVQGGMRLLPKRPVDEVLQSVDVVRHNGKLVFLHVTLQNKDWVRIEILD